MITIKNSGKFPIIVFSAYRSGSTALCDLLGTKYNLINLDESLLRHLSNKTLPANNQCVGKIIVDQINKDSNKELLNDLLPHSFNIRLRRKNVSAQIVSYYICNQSNQWHYKSSSILTDYVVDIDLVKLKQLAFVILNSNYMLGKLSIPIDQEILYENLNTIGSEFIHSYPPKNKHEVVSALQDLYCTDAQYRQYFDDCESWWKKDNFYNISP